MSPYGLNPDNLPPVEADQIRVTVLPEYAEAHSRPPSHYVFVYHVTIENVGSEDAQLFWRHWLIYDPAQGTSEVQGEGVIGESPLLEPGGRHQYQSFCVLQSPVGHMEGHYHFRRSNGHVFRAEIPRFHFAAPIGPTAN